MKRDPQVALAFRRRIERDGTWQRAQRMPESARASYLRGHFQVFARFHGTEAAAS